MSNHYGQCECGGDLFPVWFTEYEEEEITADGIGFKIKTGRTRRACSHLVCEMCLRNYCVDDSFDGPWMWGL